MLCPDPDKDDDDGRNTGASYLMCKIYRPRRGWSFFIGPAISTWDLGPIWKNELARGDPGINRLDRIAKADDLDYGKAKDLIDNWAADRKMIAKIDQLPGRKTLTERIVKNIMKAKLKLGM